MAADEKDEDVLISTTSTWYMFDLRHSGQNEVTWSWQKSEVSDGQSVVQEHYQTLPYHRVCSSIAGRGASLRDAAFCLLLSLLCLLVWMICLTFN